MWGKAQSCINKQHTETLCCKVINKLQGTNPEEKHSLEKPSGKKPSNPVEACGEKSSTYFGACGEVGAFLRSSRTH